MPLARNLRARSSKMVLALLPGLGNSFYYGDHQRGRGAGHRGRLRHPLRRHPRRPKREAHYDRSSAPARSTACSCSPAGCRARTLPSSNDSVPITLVCNDIPGPRRLPLFETDNRDAARTMAEHMVSVGHRRIAHITGPAHNPEARERIRGYRDAIAAAGIAVDECPVWPGSFSFVAGAEAAARLPRHAPVKPTAVFAASDEIAIGFIKGVARTASAVPDDVSVAGFDDIEYSGVFEPGADHHAPAARRARPPRRRPISSSA